MHYKAIVKNEETNGNPKSVSAGRNTLGVSAKVVADTNSHPYVGVEMWLRTTRNGKDMLQVNAIGNGYNVSKSGPQLFEGTIDEFVKLFGKE